MFLSQPRPGGSFLTKVSLLLVLLIAGIFAYAPVMAQVDPAVMGQWSSPESWPTISIHTHLLPTGKVMFYYYGDIIGLWDPATDTLTSLGTSSYNIFCSGHSFLADGRLLVTGGHVAQAVGLPNASIYDPADDSWTALPNMNAGRWYPTNTTLANGDVLVSSGSIDNTIGHNRLPQVWQMATSSWRDLTGVQLSLPLYPWMHLAPNGKVFNSGPNTTTRYLNTSGIGSLTFVANRTTFRDYGSSVMYDDGKVFIVGGHDPPTKTAEVINLNVAPPSWRAVSSMSIPRRQINATLLPDGKVLVTGGSSVAGFNNPAGAVLYAEMWDPATGSWTTMAGYERYRGYHSVAVLLPDGRVLSSGGDDEPNAEVYSPPYLFKGSRPTINSAPAAVGYGETFFVGTPDGASVAQANWLRLSSVTHAFNHNQRINRLSFALTTGGLNITSPASRNLCPPGHYMLFLLNSQGVPSEAKFMHIVAPPILPPAPPSNLTAAAASASKIVLNWSDNDVNESGFKIERSSDGGNTFTPIATVNPNTIGYTNGNLPSGTTYHYRVLAYNEGGESGYSNTASATTLQGPPPAPTGLTATAISSSQIDLSWVDNSGNETSFKIYRSLTTSNFAQIATVNSNVTTYSNTGLKKGTTYYYRVRAANSAGNSPLSDMANAKTP